MLKAAEGVLERETKRWELALARFILVLRNKLPLLVFLVSMGEARWSFASRDDGGYVLHGLVGDHRHVCTAVEGEQPAGCDLLQLPDALRENLLCQGPEAVPRLVVVIWVQHSVEVICARPVDDFADGVDLACSEVDDP